MKKTFILAFVLTSTVMAEQSALEKFNALVMNIHQGSDEYFVNIQSKTFAEDKNKQEHLNDEYFIKAMNELRGKKIHQLRLRKSQVSDNGLDVLAQFPTIKELELSNSNITDEGIKKIVEYCPQLKRLNIWGCKNITDNSLIYLRDLWQLEKLHLSGTKVTWQAANEYRGIMQSTAANENLSIHVGRNQPTLYAFKMEELWKRTYQTNTYNGKLNPNYKIEIIK
tara:strand:+ start:329 stop:1000 length:672 start_codon:yes stop_codon:yes gene_type:complete